MSDPDLFTRFTTCHSDSSAEKTSFTALTDARSQLSKDDTNRIWVIAYWRNIAGLYNICYSELTEQYNAPQRCWLQTYRAKGQGRNRDNHFRCLRSIERINKHWPPSFWHLLYEKGVRLPAEPAVGFVETLGRVAAAQGFDQFMTAAQSAIARKRANGGALLLQNKELQDIKNSYEQEVIVNLEDEGEQEDWGEDDDTDRDDGALRHTRKHQNRGQTAKHKSQKRTLPHSTRSRNSNDASSTDQETHSVPHPTLLSTPRTIENHLNTTSISTMGVHSISEISLRSDAGSSAFEQARAAIRSLQGFVSASKTAYREANQALENLQRSRDDLEQRYANLLDMVNSQRFSLGVSLSTGISEKVGELNKLRDLDIEYQEMNNSVICQRKERDEKKTMYEKNKQGWESFLKYTRSLRSLG